MNKLRVALVIGLLLNLLHGVVLAVPAGILPCAQFQSKNVILLGVDQHRQGLWMDFGGKSDCNETAPATAAREFSEETMFCFFASIADVKNKLKTIAPIVAPNGYHMYPLKVPFIPDLNKIQQSLRARYHVKGCFSCWLNARHIEKIDYAWIFADDLKKAFAMARGNPSKVILKSIDGRLIKLHVLLAQTLGSHAGQSFLATL